MAGRAATPGLAPGTRVQLRDGARLKGTVMPYRPEYSPGLLGLFPVRLDNWIWQTCHATHVFVLAPRRKPINARGLGGRREVTPPSKVRKGGDGLGRWWAALAARRRAALFGDPPAVDLGVGLVVFGSQPGPAGHQQDRYRGADRGRSQHRCWRGSMFPEIRCRTRGCPTWSTSSGRGTAGCTGST